MSCMVFYSFYGHVWPFVVFYGFLWWSCMILLCSFMQISIQLNLNSVFFFSNSQILIQFVMFNIVWMIYVTFRANQWSDKSTISIWIEKRAKMSATLLSESLSRGESVYFFNILYDKRNFFFIKWTWVLQISSVWTLIFESQMLDIWLLNAYVCNILRQFIWIHIGYTLDTFTSLLRINKIIFYVISNFDIVQQIYFKSTIARINRFFTVLIFLQ